MIQAGKSKVRWPRFRRNLPRDPHLDSGAAQPEPAGGAARARDSFAPAGTRQAARQPATFLQPAPPWASPRAPAANAQATIADHDAIEAALVAMNEQMTALREDILGRAEAVRVSDQQERQQALARVADLQERLADDMKHRLGALEKDRHQASKGLTELAEKVASMHEAICEPAPQTQSASLSADAGLHSHQFRYNARGLQGSAPLHIFETEPTSALRTLFIGPHAPVQDDAGYTFVNLDASDWHVVLDWLTYKAVPKAPSDALRRFADYWRLEAMLEAVHRASHTCEVLKTTDTMFEVELHFTELRKTGAPAELYFTAMGRNWTLLRNSSGVYLRVRSGDKLNINYSMALQQRLDATAVCLTTTREFDQSHAGWGWHWSSWHMKSPVARGGEDELFVTVKAKVADE